MPILRWEKAVPIKRPDNLRASAFSQKAFTPTYEQLPYQPPNMTFMVTMEYRRMWFQQRNEWQKQAYPSVKKGVAVRQAPVKKKEKEDKKAPLKQDKKNVKRYAKATSKLDTGRGCPAITTTDLVPKCDQCGAFHAMAEKCSELCKDDAFNKKVFQGR